MTEASPSSAAPLLRIKAQAVKAACLGDSCDTRCFGLKE